MAHTIKVSGISNELLSRVDERWKGQHYADRSEYVRDLIRKDVIAELSTEKLPSLSEGIRSLFGALHDEAAKRGYSDEEIAADVEEALSEVRKSRKKNSKQAA